MAKMKGKNSSKGFNNVVGVSSYPGMYVDDKVPAPAMKPLPAPTVGTLRGPATTEKSR